jgi:hypothetical protein
LGPTRTEEDALAHLEHLIASDPQAINTTRITAKIYHKAKKNGRHELVTAVLYVRANASYR